MRTNPTLVSCRELQERVADEELDVLPKHLPALVLDFSHTIRSLQHSMSEELNANLQNFLQTVLRHKEPVLRGIFLCMFAAGDLARLVSRSPAPSIKRLLAVVLEIAMGDEIASNRIHALSILLRLFQLCEKTEMLHLVRGVVSIILHQLTVRGTPECLDAVALTVLPRPKGVSSDAYTYTRHSEVARREGVPNELPDTSGDEKAGTMTQKLVAHGSVRWVMGTDGEIADAAVLEKQTKAAALNSPLLEGEEKQAKAVALGSSRYEDAVTLDEFSVEVVTQIELLKALMQYSGNQWLQSYSNVFLLVLIQGLRHPNPWEVQFCVIETILNKLVEQTPVTQAFIDIAQLFATGSPPTPTFTPPSSLLNKHYIQQSFFKSSP